MKLGDLINSLESLRVLSVKAVPAATAFTLGRVIKAAGEHEKTFNEARQKMFDLYGVPVEGTEQVRISDEHMGTFKQEMEDLLAVEIDLGDAHINISGLGSVEIEARHLMNLEWLIKG